MSTLHFTCENGHQITAPYALVICPLSRCQSVLTACGPNFGPLKSKKSTVAHYEALEEEAKQ